MNAALKPIINNIRRFPLSDQLELISEITRSLSRFHPTERDRAEKTVSEPREWLNKIIRLHPAETPTETLDCRIEQERSSWD
jgi:hypothetical protein